MEIVVGTAGHIDHGKTALVRALTGTDADRLPEEKQRGITIDIGFAELKIGNIHYGFIDVPGHERFVKNMLAGASGIDMVMLVIAADEGVMPQTREHFEICRLLGLSNGIIVLTKSDLADNETLDLARLDAAELVAGSFLENAPVVVVSSVTETGIDKLKTELSHIAETNISTRKATHVAFLPIDRSFSVKGFGSVVTGTLASGAVSEGAELELLPQKKAVRVRGVQTHGRSVKSAQAGQRTAVNLAGVDHGELSRGMVLSEPNVFEPTQIFDAVIELLPDVSAPLHSRQRVRVHVGTAEVLARISVINESGEMVAGTRGFVQFRLESPIAAFLGQRFIVRSYSPQATIGGGQILAVNAEKFLRKKTAARTRFLSELNDSQDDIAATAKLFIEKSEINGTSLRKIIAATGWIKEIAQNAIEQNIKLGTIIEIGGLFITASDFAKLAEQVIAMVNDFHKREPLAFGISREELRERTFKYLPINSFAAVLTALTNGGKIAIEKDTIRLAGHKTQFSLLEKNVLDDFLQNYAAARFEPPKLEEVLANARAVTPTEAKKLFQMLVKSGEIIQVSEEFYFASTAIDELTDALRTFADSTPDRLIDVASFKQIAGVSRKYAIPLLEYFDRKKLTVRAGDKRLVLA